MKAQSIVFCFVSFDGIPKFGTLILNLEQSYTSESFQLVKKMSMPESYLICSSKGDTEEIVTSQLQCVPNRFNLLLGSEILSQHISGHMKWPLLLQALWVR